MLGYVHDTTKIWRLWDPVEEHVIQASNVKFDESLMEGKQVIHEQTQDTLQDLRNSEAVEDPENGDTKHSHSRLLAKCEATTTGLVIEVERGSSTQKAKREVNLLTQNRLLNPKSFGVLHPNSYKEALSSGQSAGWKTAMREELAALKANDTWDYVPAGNKSAMGCWWVFRTKINADNWVT